MYGFETDSLGGYRNDGGLMSEKSPTVSVLLSTYNRADLLPRAIESVFAQTLTDWELIIVDDASDDDTGTAVEPFLDDDRVTYIRHEYNQGLSAARNTGLDAATGNYIATLDDDDEWSDSEKLAKQVRILDESDETVAFVCSNIKMVNDDGDERIVRVERPDNLTRHILKRNGIFYSPTVMFKPWVFEEIGRFDTRLPRGVDSDIYRRLIINGYEPIFMSDVTTTVYTNIDIRITHKQELADYHDSIDSAEVTLEKFADVFEQYPEAKASRLGTLALDWFGVFRRSGSLDDLWNALRYAWSANRTDPSIKKRAARLVWQSL
jgi:glycosyltransferase involved in cell wall biosynthesis